MPNSPITLLVYKYSFGFQKIDFKSDRSLINMPPANQIEAC